MYSIRVDRKRQLIRTAVTIDVSIGIGDLDRPFRLVLYVPKEHYKQEFVLLRDAAGHSIP